MKSLGPFKKIGATLLHLAPDIALGLGGPMAQMATSTIINAVLPPPPAGQLPHDPTDPNVVARAEDIISQATDPQVLIDLKKANQGFAAQMKSLDVDLEKLNEQDTESARTRQVATKDRTPTVLAYSTVALFWIYASTVMWLLMHGKMTDVGNTFAATVLGYAISEVKLVYGFFFGSSSGSQAKDSVLASIATNGGK